VERKKRLVQMVLGVALAGLLVLATAGIGFATEKFGLKDIPEIKNKTPIHVSVFGGLPVAEKLMPIHMKAFSEKTGVPVTYEALIMTSIYPKLNVELIGGTGAYDAIVVEASTTNEWAMYLWPLKELAKKYEPDGVAALEEYLEGFDKTMLRTCSDRKGGLYGIPYWNYQQFTAYRQDVFEDPTEKANFKKKYGYELAPPKTRKQLYDQGEFFTRKKGEMLKGQPLKENIYGLGLMAGRFEINDEFSSLIWGAGGHWATVVRGKDGNPKEFVITKKNKQMLKDAMVYYKSLLKFASPGCLTGHWDFTTAQFVEGKCIIIPFFYVSLDSWGGSVKDKIPGAKMGLAMTIGGQPYVGNFYTAVAKASKNPEATYWLIKYFGSFDCQKEIHEGGLSAVRRDVLDDPKYKAEEWWEKCARRGAANSAAFKAQLPYVSDYLHFNSVAMGKIYEMQIIELHEAAIGKVTPEEMVKRITNDTIKLQKKFGELPIREEK